MFGSETTFICKSCGKEQKVSYSAAWNYSINDSKCMYTDFNCCNCGVTNYVAHKAVAIDENTVDCKDKAFSERRSFMGSSERARKYFFDNASFVTKDKRVLLKSDIVTIEEVSFEMS